MTRWSALLILVLTATASADDPPTPTPFDRGHVNLSGGAGSQNLFGVHYIVVGAGVGYFVLDGLAVELSGLHEFGSGPSISQLEPGLRYLAQPLVGRSPVIPYVGGFYKHWFLGGGYDDVDTVGARAGLVYLSGRLIVGLGAVYEHTVSSCATDCDTVYPDVTLGFTL